jgi:hypothetical protein
MFLALLTAAATVASAQHAQATCVAVGQSDPAALRYICESERAWSRSVASGDTSAPTRVLADDYVGIGSSGNRFTKGEMAAQPPRTSKAVSFSDNDYVRVRFFGSTALNQGRDSIRTKDGRKSHLIWTDTWLKRDGKWQVVQSQDAELESSK